MAKVLKLERERVQRLAASLERELRAGDLRELRVPVADVSDPRLWRRAAVMASHRLGFKASTFSAGGMWVLLVHRPVTEAERRQAAIATTSWILQGGRTRT